MTGAFLVDWVGRRPLFITSTAGMFIGKYTVPSIVCSSKLTKPCAAFCMWTLTTALFNALHNTAAAKGTSDLTFSVALPLIWYTVSHRSAHFVSSPNYVLPSPARLTTSPASTTFSMIFALLPYSCHIPVRALVRFLHPPN
jgi:hypothetical protein